MYVKLHIKPSSTIHTYVRGGYELGLLCVIHIFNSRAIILMEFEQIDLSEVQFLCPER